MHIWSCFCLENGAINSQKQLTIVEVAYRICGKWKAEGEGELKFMKNFVAEKKDCMQSFIAAMYINLECLKDKEQTWKQKIEAEGGKGVDFLKQVC